MMVEPDISVVICAYTEERWEDLVAAVESLRCQTVSPREIVVVIDHNPSLRDRAVASLEGVVVVENQEAPGLSGGRNTGVMVAQGKVIAFLDDDAVASPTWLEHLHAWYADPQVLGVGGSSVPLWSTPPPAWFPDEFYWTVGCTYRGLPQAAAPVRNLLGGCMSMRREVLAEGGGFRSGIGRDADRPLGCEETELCIRASQRWPDGIWLYAPRAQIFHRVPESRGRWKYFRSRCYAEGLSKALVSEHVGAGDGLSSERAYTLHVLPFGVLRGVRDAACGDLWGLARAGAIVGGLFWTATGYLVGRRTLRQRAPCAASSRQGAQPSTQTRPA